MVSLDEKKQCTATIDDAKIIGKIGSKVAWVAEDYGCGADWHLELEFATGWNHGGDRTVKVRRNDIKSVTINRATLPTEGKPLYYKVILVIGKSRIELIDPELEIER